MFGNCRHRHCHHPGVTRGLRLADAACRLQEEAEWAYHPDLGEVQAAEEWAFRLRFVAARAFQGARLLLMHQQQRHQQQRVPRQRQEQLVLLPQPGPRQLLAPRRPELLQQQAPRRLALAPQRLAREQAPQPQVQVEAQVPWVLGLRLGAFRSPVELRQPAGLLLRPLLPQPAARAEGVWVWVWVWLWPLVRGPVPPFSADLAWWRPPGSSPTCRCLRVGAWRAPSWTTPPSWPAPFPQQPQARERLGPSLPSLRVPPFDANGLLVPPRCSRSGFSRRYPRSYRDQGCPCSPLQALGQAHTHGLLLAQAVLYSVGFRRNCRTTIDSRRARAPKNQPLTLSADSRDTFCSLNRSLWSAGDVAQDTSKCRCTCSATPAADVLSTLVRNARPSLPFSAAAMKHATLQTQAPRPVC